MPIKIEGEECTIDGYFCPKCEVVFFRDRNVRKAKEIIIPADNKESGLIVEGGKIGIANIKKNHICICRNDRKTIKENQEVLITRKSGDIERYHTWAFYCKNCKTFVPIGVENIRWICGNRGEKFEIHKKPETKGKSKFQRCFCGTEECEERVDYILIGKKQLKVNAAVCTRDYCVFIKLDKKRMKDIM
ncbi:MAG: hypothetical protein ABIG20_04850 [archaeon]